MAETEGEEERGRGARARWGEEPSAQNSRRGARTGKVPGRKVSEAKRRELMQTEEAMAVMALLQSVR
eukprot:2718630-Rhodomonas_salina.1